MMAPTSQFTGKERDDDTDLDFFGARYDDGVLQGGDSHHCSQSPSRPGEKAVRAQMAEAPEGDLGVSL